MKRALKILFVVFVVFVGLCVAGVAVLLTLDLNEYKDTIAEKAKEATGRDLIISGGIAIDWSMAPTLRVEGVSLANADWGSRKAMLTLELLEAQVELMPLLSKQVRIPRVTVKGLDVLAETNAEGKGNWVMAGMTAEKAEPAEAGEGGAPIIPVVEQVVIENVKVAFKDGQTGQAIEAVLDSLQASSEDSTKPVVISLKGAINGAPIAVAGSVGAPAALMANESYPLSLKAKALEVVAAVDGAIGHPMEAKGIDVAVSADIADLAKTLEAASVIVPDLAARAEGMAPTAISFAGKAADTADGYALKGMKLVIGESDLSGDAAISLGGVRPKATATINSTKLDLNSLAAPRRWWKNRSAGSRASGGRQGILRRPVASGRPQIGGRGHRGQRGADCSAGRRRDQGCRRQGCPGRWQVGRRSARHDRRRRQSRGHSEAGRLHRNGQPGCRDCRQGNRSRRYPAGDESQGRPPGRSDRPVGYAQRQRDVSARTDGEPERRHCRRYRRGQAEQQDYRRGRRRPRHRACSGRSIPSASRRNTRS